MNGGRDHLVFSRKHEPQEFSGQTLRHRVTTESETGTVFPLCRHSEDRLFINKLSSGPGKHTHFSASFHPVSQCCSHPRIQIPLASQACKTHIMSQDPDSVSTLAWPVSDLRSLPCPPQTLSFSSIQFYCPSRLQLAPCLRSSGTSSCSHAFIPSLNPAACNRKPNSKIFVFSNCSLCVGLTALYSFPSEAGYIETLI